MYVSRRNTLYPVMPILKKKKRKKIKRKRKVGGGKGQSGVCLQPHARINALMARKAVYIVWRAWQEGTWTLEQINRTTLKEVFL